MDVFSSNQRHWTIRRSLHSSSCECSWMGESIAMSPIVLSFPLVLKVQLPELVTQNVEDTVCILLTLNQEMEQTVLLLWFFMASLRCSSLVILLLMPSRYTARSNKPAPNGMLSLPGRSLTWNMPMTGRWSEVLIDEQDVYLTTLMSLSCLLLNRIRSVYDGVLCLGVVS